MCPFSSLKVICEHHVSIMNPVSSRLLFLIKKQTTPIPLSCWTYMSRRQCVSYAELHKNQHAKQNHEMKCFTNPVSLLPLADCIPPPPSISLMHSRSIMSLFGSSHPTAWAKAISDAEKLVGYPTSFLSLRCLLSDELANVALHVRKLVGTRHPLLRTAKNFLTDGKHNLQTRGLIVLLVSKAANTSAHEAPYDSRTVSSSSGIYASQRALAEISEMIHMAFLVHRGVVNLLHLDPSDGPMKVMEFGNKMAVLSGDFLLASACSGLAQLRNMTVVELISKAIANLTEAAFMTFGNSDLLQPVALQPDLTFSDWENYVYLSSGTLIGHSCRGALELTSHSSALTQGAFDFGKNLAWAQQLHAELQPFISNTSPRGPANVGLTSAAPVILYMEANEHKGQRAGGADYTKQMADRRKLVRAIRSSPALDKAKSLCQSYGDGALQALGAFPQSDARRTLENMVHAVRV